MAATLPVDPERPEAAVLREAADLLRSGQLVAFPTETVYGLAGLALSTPSLEAIFRAKGRPATHPLIAHVFDQAGARQLVRNWPAQATLLANRFWPGPLTLVLERDPLVPAALSGGKPTIAVRVPAHPVSLGLLAALGEPIAAPSANHYQSLSPTRAEHVQRSLGDRIALILDGGPTPLGLESTVVDLTGPKPRLLRPGALSTRELRESLPDLIIETAAPDSEADRHSPGQDLVHYAPRARLEVLPRRQAIERARATPRAGLILRAAPGPALEEEAAGPVRLLPRSPTGFGRELFAALHDLDAAGVDLILVESPPDDEAWLAVRDRLQRASGAR